MRSTEVYRILREEVGPWAKSEGFKRADCMLSWQRPQGNRHLVFRFQVWLDGFDPYAGSKFTAEFQLGARPVVASGPSTRKRLSSLLEAADLDELRQMQNAVIRSLPRPPRDYPLLRKDALTREWYLGKFQPVETPYEPTEDVWLRYHTPAHVREWARFLVQRLPTVVARVEGWAAAEREGLS